MNLATLLILARPATRVDRIRTTIVAGSVAFALAMVLVSLAIVAVAPYSWRDGGASAPTAGLSEYVVQAGLQPGVVVCVLVATLPLLALALQAIRLGATDRNRLSRALTVAGASPHQQRLVSAARAGWPIAVGSLLAGPVHLLLWLLLGPALPLGARFVPAPTGRLALAWLAAAVIATLAGALLGALDTAPNDPAGPHTRRPAAIVGRAGIAVALCVVLASGLVAMNQVVRRSDDVVLPVAAGLVAVALLAGGSAGFAANARRRARRLHRRGDAVAVLAAARVNADVAVLGRTGGTLFVSGIVLAVASGLGIALLFGADAVDSTFFATGIGAIAGVVVIAWILAGASLVLTALDYVLTARRALATLAVVGGDEALVRAAIATQFAVVAVPALTLGTALGGLMTALVFQGWGAAVVIEIAVAAMALCALIRWATRALCRSAARIVGPAIRAAMRAEHLRAA